MQTTFLADMFCGNCALRTACGGAITAPCGCVYTGTAKENQCHDCIIGCTRRKDGSEDFLAHVMDGIDLENVRVHHGTDFPTLPLVLPIKGGKSKVHLPARFATVDLRQMLQFFNTRRKGTTLHDRVHVPAGIPLVGVMNSTDDVLERFWSMKNRAQFFTCLEEAGVIAIAGPTFSVIDETVEGRTTPESHKVLMLRRHHKILIEIAENGIMPIPNLYFRNQFDIDAWAGWLKVNTVLFIKRDFSLTKNISEFVEKEIQSMKEIIIKSGKVFHIIFTGIGAANAETFLREFAAIGCRCSFVTSDPLQKAMIGGKRLYELNGKLEATIDWATPNPSLVYPNYAELESFLSKIGQKDYSHIYRATDVSNFDKPSVAEILRQAA